MNYQKDNKAGFLPQSPLILIIMIMLYWSCFADHVMFINLENKTFCTWHMMWKVWVAKSQLSYSIVVNRLSMVFELEDEKRNLKLRCRSLPLIGILSNLEISSSDKNGSASLLCNLIGRTVNGFNLGPFNWLLPSIIFVDIRHFSFSNKRSIQYYILLNHRKNYKKITFIIYENRCIIIIIE